MQSRVGPITIGIVAAVVILCVAIGIYLVNRPPASAAAPPPVATGAPVYGRTAPGSNVGGLTQGAYQPGYQPPTQASGGRAGGSYNGGGDVQRPNTAGVPQGPYQPGYQPPSSSRH